MLLLWKFEPLTDSILFETVKNCTASGCIMLQKQVTPL